MNETKPLIIVNASAGSGKTYRLVKEYIQLLISKDKQTRKFASIMAMTFTNKASLEMKKRILSTLDALANRDYFPGEHEDLLVQLSNDIGISTVEVIDRCRKSLRQLLHAYEDFHVMTIDKFNLKLIKSFSRDLELPADFEVILNEDDLTEQVVDKLFDQLGKQHIDDELNIFMQAYARDNLDNESSWNFRSSLIQFASVLKPEKNLPIIEKLIASDFSPEHYQKLQLEQHKIRQQFILIRDELKKAMLSEIPDPSKIPGGSRSYNVLENLCSEAYYPEKRFSDQFLKYLEEGTKTSQFPDQTKELLYRIHTFRERSITVYTRLQLFRKEYFNLGLLKHIASELNEMKKNEQILRISEFNKLISELIRGEEAPFIYEKLGNRFQHFMLDEFQDTSNLQWLNMVPLLHESISTGNLSFVVGDPKQSIYRFKNGVAEQFIELPGIYNPSKDPDIERRSAYFRKMGVVEELTDNWRSSEVIVNFNNAFFESFRKMLPEHSKEFYETVRQTAQRKIPGYVSIVSRELEKETDHLIPQIVERIETCLTDGYLPSDICILGNKNIECNNWAIELTEMGYHVVSSDSLLIFKDRAVKLVIAYLKLRLRPNSEHALKRFSELLIREKNGSFTEYTSFLQEESSIRNIRVLDRQRFIHTYFSSENAFFFNYEHLYDLLMKTYHLLGLDELKNPYLHHLSDFTFLYNQMRGADLKRFLDEYEKEKYKLAIQLPERKDALQIMTIHKAKGLEFPVVIIPTMNFSLDIRNKMLLENDDRILYVQPSKSSELPEVLEANQIEKDQILIDCLNLCYVGLTRPKERFYLINHYIKNRFGLLFHEVLESLPGSNIVDNYLFYESGKPVPKKEHAKDTEKEHNYVPSTLSNRLWFPDIALSDQPEMKEKGYLSEQIQFGLQFHLLVSSCKPGDSIDDLLKDHINNGKIDSELMDRLSESLTVLHQNEQYCTFYEKAVEIISEARILVNQDIELQPDKVICHKDKTILIDYKTGEKLIKHAEQLNAYRQILDEMNFPDIRCYLYYTQSCKLVELPRL